jgi:aminomethyltransferase
MVRSQAGVFDVSHMGVIDVQGADAKKILRRVLANDVGKLTAGKALYSCMLNLHAGILDDLIVYCFSDQHYRLVVNAVTTEKDIAWLEEQGKQFAVKIQQCKDLAILAVQGPSALEGVKKALTAEQRQACETLTPYHFTMVNNWLLARTGYTGEEGLEIILPQEDIEQLWQNLLANSIKPAGIGARDSLRLEAGFNLYGADMDETVTPFESNLAWTVDFKDTERDFIGKERLLKQQQKGIKEQLVGLVLLGQGVSRAGMVVYMYNDASQEVYRGKLTSGGYSPTLARSIALARIPVGEFSHIEVDIRGKKIPAKIIKPPFVRNGKLNFSLEDNLSK